MKRLWKTFHWKAFSSLVDIGRCGTKYAQLSSAVTKGGIRAAFFFSRHMQYESRVLGANPDYSSSHLIGCSGTPFVIVDAVV
jgi:hypothetical protein